MTLKQSVSELVLIPSSGGAFEITVEGETIYSKLETGDFPDFDEILNRARSLI